VDRWLWTITGDVPPAYLVTDDARKPREALEGYVFEMRRWVRKVRAHKDLTDVIPVDVPPQRSTPTSSKVASTS
jgi:hypothetical protein